MDARQLIRQNLEIENEIDPAGDLTPKPGRETTLFAVYRHAGGTERFYFAGLPGEIRRRLAALPPEAALTAHGVVREILSPLALEIEVFSGVGCCFAARPEPREYPGVARQGRDFVILVDGRRAGWAWTPGESGEAAELAVETLQACRGRGYGRQVALAWAAAVMASGRTAFYSYRAGNALSEALARSLGVVKYAEFTNYSR